MKFKEGDKVVALPNAPYGITTATNGFGIVKGYQENGFLRVAWYGKYTVFNEEGYDFDVDEKWFALVQKRWRDVTNE
jgi:hypothetical protein